MRACQPGAQAPARPPVSPRLKQPCTASAPLGIALRAARGWLPPAPAPQLPPEAAQLLMAQHGALLSAPLPIGHQAGVQAALGLPPSHLCGTAAARLMATHAGGAMLAPAADPALFAHSGRSSFTTGGPPAWQPLRPRCLPSCCAAPAPLPPCVPATHLRCSVPACPAPHPHPPAPPHPATSLAVRSSSDAAAVAAGSSASTSPGRGSPSVLGSASSDAAAATSLAAVLGLHPAPAVHPRQ